MSTAENDAPGFEAGIRQAIEWLRADYAYGEGPEWREHGCEWIADRLAEHTRSPVIDDHEFNWQTGYCACGWAGPAIDLVPLAHAAHVAECVKRVTGGAS